MLQGRPRRLTLPVAQQIVTHSAAGCITVNTCALIEGLVADVNWGTDYDITATASGTEPDDNGVSVSCTVTDGVDSTVTATFTGIGACN